MTATTALLAAYAISATGVAGHLAGLVIRQARRRHREHDAVIDQTLDNGVLRAKVAELTEAREQAS